jgi:broad specificity phosphatase PhoE
MRLFLIRHADPDYPNNTITEHGHREAAALADRLARLGLDRIYSSPMPRAYQTAEYTAKLLHLPIQIEEWTRELAWRIEHPTLGRVPVWDVPGEEFRGDAGCLTLDSWDRLGCLSGADLRPLYEELQAQGDEYLERLGYRREGARYRVVRRNVEKVALFCHGGFGLALLAHLLHVPLTLAWSGFWLPPSSVTTVLMDERSDGWAVPRCTGLGDVSHLYAAGLPVQHRGLLANVE